MYRSQRIVFLQKYHSFDIKIHCCITIAWNLPALKTSKTCSPSSDCITCIASFFLLLNVAPISTSSEIVMNKTLDMSFNKFFWCNHAKRIWIFCKNRLFNTKTNICTKLCAQESEHDFRYSQDGSTTDVTETILLFGLHRLRLGGVLHLWLEQRRLLCEECRAHAGNNRHRFFSVEALDLNVL